MPGHETVSRFGRVLFGDPRSCLHRSNISMIIMRRRSMGIAAGAVGFIRGIVIRWRGDVEQFASERGLALRAEPASRPQCRMRWKARGRTLMRKRWMNSSVASLVTC